MRAEPNITRIDYGNTHAWWVRFQRGAKADGGRKVISKLFSDGVYGGKRKALRAAIIWRDSIEPRLPKRLRGGTAEMLPGYGYVRRTQLKGRTGAYHDVWAAWVRLDGGPDSNRQTSRSVVKWGVRGAKAEAERWLEQQRRQLASRRRRIAGRS